MKTTPPHNNYRLIGPPILALLLSFTPALRANPAAASAEPKDRTLFMGLNLMILDGQDYFPVLDVSHDSAVIKVNGQLKLVPFSKISGYRLKKEFKAGPLPAPITHLEGDRAYTPGNDPSKIWHNRQIQLTGYTDDRTASAAGDIVENGLHSTGALFNPRTGARLPNTGDSGTGPAYRALDAQINGQGETNNDGFYAEKLQEDLDKHLFDAMEVNFDVSSAKTLEDPYVVIVTEFRENEKTKDTSRWIYIKPLQPIDSRPTKVHILEGGFPKGFALGKYEVHLYDSGREIPTTVAENRMAVTQGEVYLYTGFQYLSDHKGQTLPPTPILESAPAHLRDDFTASQLNQAFEIKVSKQGEVVGLDAAGSGPIPPAIQSLWQRLRYFPALENGKPAAAAFEARLADFIR